MDNSSVIVCETMVSIVFDSRANSFYSTVMHLLSALNTLVTALSAWAILGHTPSQMQTYRWYLLNLAVSVEMSQTSHLFEWVGFLSVVKLISKIGREFGSKFRV